MPDFTPNLNLIKPLGNENFSVSHANSNADKLDSSFEFLDNKLIVLEQESQRVNNNLENKVDKVTGKNLSSNDFTDSDKNLVNQVTQKAFQSYVDAQLSAIVSGSPKGTFTDFAALVASYPNGTDGVFLTLSDGHWYYFDSEDSIWKDGGVYQSETIADNSVGANMTNFVRIGKNKFDGNYTKDIAISGNSTSGGSLVYQANARCAIVKLEQSKSYVVSRGSGGDRFRVALSIGKPTVGKSFSRVLFFEDSRTEYSFSTQGNEDYAAIYVSSNGSSLPSFLQVEEGTSKTNYTPQKYIIGLEENSIGVESVQNLRVKAILTGNNSAINVNLDQQVIIVNKNLGSFVNLGNQRFEIETGNYSYASLNNQTIIVLFNLENKTLEFYSNESVNNKENRSKALVGVIRKDTKNVNFEGNYRINNLNVLPYTGGSSDYKNKFILTDNFSGNYESESDYIEAGGTILSNDVFSIYNSLVTDYPDYVSKVTLGVDSGGKNIFRYNFTPPKPYNYNNYVIPKIYYQSGIHGHEKRAVMAGASFFKELCENWKTDEALSALRWNISFSVVPIVNVSGFDLNQRKNANGVDLNRNFPIGWVLNPDQDSINYGGTSPLSEPESTIVDNIVKNENDILFIIDHHNSGYFSTENFISWFGTNDEKVRMLAAGLANQITSYLKKNEFGNIDSSNANLVLVEGATNGSFIRNAESYNKKSVLLESSLGWGSNFKNVQNVATTSLGSLILGVAKNYDKLQ